MTDLDKESIGMIIHSDPEVTDIRQQPEEITPMKVPELPLRLLFVSDLSPEATQSSHSRCLSVDKYSFAELMRNLAPKLFLNVPNHISETPDTLELELSFTELKSFRPEQLVAEIPALSSLLQVRSLVSQVKESKIDPATFKERLGKTGIDPDWAAQLHQALIRPPHPVSPKRPSLSETDQPDALDRLLGMVDLGGEEPEKAPAPPGPSGPLGSLLKAVTGDASEPVVEASAADLIISELDEVLGRQVRAILVHPAFQKLESAWRGLKFLVERIDFRRNIRLDVLATGKEQLTDRVRHLLLPSDSGEPAPIPPSVVILDSLFGGSTLAVQELTELVDIAATAQVPLIAGTDLEQFGLDTDGNIDNLPVLWQHFQHPAYLAWNALRDDAASSYLTIVLPRFLLRDAYGSRNPVKGFNFEENGIPSRSAHLWGNGALAIGVAIAQRFVNTGWPTRFSGDGSGCRIGDLPLWEICQGHVPLESLWPLSKQEELSEAGFAVLQCYPNDDSITVAFAPSIHRPGTYESIETTAKAHLHATLSCRLFVSRVFHHVLAFQEALSPGTSAQQIETALSQWMEALLKRGGHEVIPDTITVVVSDHPDRFDQYTVTLSLRAPASILGIELDLRMDFETSCS